MQSRLRIERHMGGLIPQMQRAGALRDRGKDKEQMSNASTFTATLTDYSITRDQSSTWQKLARIETEVFEDYDYAAQVAVCPTRAP